MNGMTVVAAHVVAPVAPCLPEGKVPVAGVAAHTGFSLLPRGNGPFVEAHRVLVLRRIALMLDIDPVAGGTGLATTHWRSRVGARAVLGLQYSRLVLVAAQAIHTFFSLR